MTADDLNRFMRMVLIPAEKHECWVWTGNTPYGRYGHFSVGTGLVVKAHRWIYELTHGTIPIGKVIRHKCDNPCCVNPIHLEIGTLSDNTRDAVSRGRWSNRQGTKHPLARLTESDVKEIRREASCGKSHDAIAANHSISRQHVGKIVRRVNWSHI